MQARTTTSETGLEDATLIAGVLEGPEPAPGSEEAFATVERSVLESAGFEAKSGELIVLPHPEAAALLLVGLGDEVSYDSIKTASGDAIRRVKTERAVSLLGGIGVDGATRAVTEGSLLGGYEFRTYKTEVNGINVQTLEVIGGDGVELDNAVVMAEATMLARDWVNTPAGDKSPESLAGLMAGAAEDTGIEVEIWDRARIEDEKLGGLLGVAAGSDRDPRVVFGRYRPEGAGRHLALVGKGIIFDSGGLSIKPAKSMEVMKNDMAGAAAVIAATIAISRLGVPVDVTAIAPLTDNVIGGDATRPGDVLRPVDGPTIEVLNTDAEGRLILADGLGLAKRYEPDLTVDVA
ncbi:MAG TPA: M17 family peptidase N-terminal domain-containing protein, partial [Acidimicrobiia bacterium]|nr:M17 family peptidase N-terminal domain-containing protein [Acidimicrobiia bacterium]